MSAPIAVQIRISRVAALMVMVSVVVGAVAWRATASERYVRPPATPTAVAVVNLPIILEGLEERLVRQGSLDDSGKARQAQLDALSGRIKVVEEDLKVLKAGTAEYREKLIELRELQVSLEARFKLLNQVLSFERGAVLRELYFKINDAVKRVAERDGYDVVLLNDEGFQIPEEAGQDDMNRAVLSRSVLYTHESVDISAAVVRLMNNEFQSGRRP
ncbi:MAG: OmpH family outer membrane protein [Phycisphaeraceae bacterium]|nr:OmpH family outer membrane protein [Phycisphaeraceae bacterium]MCW5763713.1 OmpH family outer membrane protein [Phycisphaeraceae bacterium]